MQLNKIKIAGFKSFVDPSVLLLPGKLTAIVGPNGCGKSNIIDAVIWVMGESSPKYLRGESLMDVIFNGSTARQPVGQASVELIFDNSSGGFGGEFANFTEISVKRVINRDSDSSYYLNGSRCRKRDIADIFLGTGLGPRSYSIIGQNMIGRIIEAKPDDLRAYLEEAAGISKYKERRRETELRIQHTRENLARVNDLKTELEKQLVHLKHQANAAEKFKLLKQQEHLLKAECYAIEWRQLDQDLVSLTLQIQTGETALESRNSEIIIVNRNLEQTHHELRTTRDALDEIQRRSYALSNEITRIEQDILRHKERKQQWENDLTQTEEEDARLKIRLTEVSDKLQEAEQDIHRLEPALQNVQEAEKGLEADLVSADEAVQAWQVQWDNFNQQFAKVTQTAQVEQTHIQHLEQTMTSLRKRIEKLQQDQAGLNFKDLENSLDECVRKIEDSTEATERSARELDEKRQMLKQLSTDQHEASANLDKVRSELQCLRGQQTSLQALQETALGRHAQKSLDWVATHQLDTKPRLAEQIEVEKGWELAVEKALDHALQAICVENFNDLLPYINDLKNGNVCIFNTSGHLKTEPAHQKPAALLIDKVKSPWPLDSFLAGIYAVDSLTEAMRLSEKLSVNESVITPDGTWISQAWIKLRREDSPALGIFQREQELKELSTRITSLQATQDKLDQEIKQRRERIQSLEQQRDEAVQGYSQQQAKLAQWHTQKKMAQERLSELKLRAERYLQEQTECNTQLQQAEADLVKARSLWQQALEELEERAATRTTLEQQRTLVRGKLQEARDVVNNKKKAIHELELNLHAARSQKASLHQQKTGLQAQSSSLNERRMRLQSELTSMPSLESINKNLTRALDQYAAVGAELNTARIGAEVLDKEWRQLENKRQAVEQDITFIRDNLSSLRVEWQGRKVKADALIVQISEIGYRLEEIMQELDQAAILQEWQAKLDHTSQRIARLGAINLVAIEEYASCQERKTYIEKQMEDLQAGLAELEGAIAKIDKETKTRFEETFNKVNARFQELFPLIFGGGKAYLELTSSDLLEAGVTLMACPPGKRNSSIYLLSGGEKSLTALAFVFSIFHLNPAPFCLLDEVDAALDDSNVLRFTRLLKSMAEKTQFIYISHNKLAIEMGEHLIGVTMNEPGVSRLVSVDINKAMSLAGV